MTQINKVFDCPNLVLSEILLQTIVEKLESLELAWKVTGDTENETVVQLKREIEFLRNDLKNLPTQMLPATAKLGELSAGIAGLR
ncbi:MAG: hypothetical protein M0Q26_11905 [Chitinophagaceae bacterium]|nr:hypothetical protein [Chitinophagaceae bacterium]